MLSSRPWQYLSQYAVTLQTLMGVTPTGYTDAVFTKEWQVLGPFQVGTREAVWGADPLEFLGGFRALEYSPNATFTSSLPFNGTVQWSHFDAKLSTSSGSSLTAELTVGFPDIDWRFLQDVYGWASLQWQGWARGEIHLLTDEPKVYSLFLENILELWVDGKHFFGGDFYGFHRAPITLYLDPGKHRIDVRLVRDVRAMGGVGEPQISVKLELQESSELLQPVYWSLGTPGNVLLSDLAEDINGPLGSPYGSATVRNDAPKPISVFSIIADPNSCESELVDGPVNVVPGQSRPIAFRIACIPPATGRGAIDIKFNYSIDGEDKIRQLSFSGWPMGRRLDDAQKFTFRNKAGFISYAVLRPPQPDACPERRNESWPILLQLHGAGVDADSDMVKHSLDKLPDLCAWVLFPTGSTLWSGDDWHNWGFADVEAAISAIPDWMENVGWEGPGIDLDRWLVSGHSNGGQGTWYAITHHPDRVFAATPVSGYSSIQNYVPYTFWQPSEPGRTSVVQSALNSYRHELLVENLKGIPITIQHGGGDDNVPAYHARLLNQRLKQAGVNSTLVEIPQKPHWWDGVMTTRPLAEFYRMHLNSNISSEPSIHLESFTVVSANNGDQGPKYGVQILGLITPGQLGKVHITLDPLTLMCTFYTTNVYQFLMPSWMNDCDLVTIDGQDFGAARKSTDLIFSTENGQWMSSKTIPPVPVRMGRQLGTIDSVLRTEGAFRIVPHSPEAHDIAVQISRNLFQYFAADTIITEKYDDARMQSKANIISVAIGADLPRIIRGYHAFQIIGDELQIEDSEGGLRRFASRPNGLAAIFLRPISGEKLELVVWAADVASLDIAARLAPLMSGTGVPDFVVADRSMLAKGIEGTLAMGFLGPRWQVTRNSFFT